MRKCPTDSSVLKYPTEHDLHWLVWSDTWQSSQGGHWQKAALPQAATGTAGRAAAPVDWQEAARPSDCR